MPTTEKPLRTDWLSAALLLGPFVGWALVRNRPPWGDEEHFLQTVRLFGNGWSVDLLRTYPEMSAPLTYLAYSAWGAVAGFDTAALRLLSPAIAGATSIVWLMVLTRTIHAPLLVLMALVTVVLNPYFLGLAVFVFTDMLALLGLALVAMGVSRRNIWLAAAGLAVATCARQYLAFVAVALAGLALLEWRSRDSRKWLAAAVAGMLPLALLVWIWNGQLSPDNELRTNYTVEGLRFDPHALSLYLSVPAVYLLPLVGATLARSRPAVLQFVPAALAALLVLIFPIEPAGVQVAEGSVTVGFFHRFVAALLPGMAERVLFAGLAFVNVLAMAAAFSIARGNGNNTRARVRTFAWLGAVSFLLVMPFSYMPWEKYALPLLMLQGLALALAIDSSPQPADHDARRR